MNGSLTRGAQRSLTEVQALCKLRSIVKMRVVTHPSYPSPPEGNGAAAEMRSPNLSL